MTETNQQARPEKIRLSFLIDSISTWQAGTERQLRILLDRLDRSLFEVQLVLLRPSSVEVDFEPTKVVLSDNEPGHSPLTIFGNLRSILKSFRPHIVQAFFIDSVFYGAIVSSFLRGTVFISSRRSVHHWKDRRSRNLIRIANRFTDYWQCNSQAVKDALVTDEHVPSNRVQVLQNCLDTHRFVPADESEKRKIRAELNIPVDVPVFVSVANLRPVKDPRTLIEAAISACSDIKNAVFILVGEGPLRNELEQRVRNSGLETNFRFVGTQKDVRPFLVAADVGILTSQAEGSSNALLEYMAAGLPTVVTDIPANRELVRRALFPVGSSRDLADTLISLGKDSCLREEIGKENLSRVQSFSVEAFLLQAQQNYIDLVS